MSNKIEMSKEYFLKHIVEKLKIIDEKLCEVDTILYEKEDMYEEWQKIRDFNLEIEELIKALE
jgi:hypothetical protein